MKVIIVEPQLIKKEIKTYRDFKLLKSDKNATLSTLCMVYMYSTEWLNILKLHNCFSSTTGLHRSAQYYCIITGTAIVKCMKDVYTFLYDNNVSHFLLVHNLPFLSHPQSQRFQYCFKCVLVECIWRAALFISSLNTRFVSVSFNLFI